MLHTRLATAAVAIPALIWLILYSPAWVFAGVIIAFTAVGLGEFANMALPERRGFQAFAVATGLALAASVVVGRAELLGFVLVLAIVSGLVLSLADTETTAAVGRLAHAFLAALYVGVLFPHVVSLRMLPGGGPRWVLLAVGCAMAADSAGYFTGRAMGRRKLSPRISPNKTVEGAVGALLGSVAFALVMLGVMRPPGYGFGKALLVGIGIGVLAQAGDMVESMLKRAYGCKDSGWIFPGHGGVLDRIDSLVLPFVFTYYLNVGV